MIKLRSGPRVSTHCGVNALYEKAGVQRRLAQADRLARAVGLDMVEAGWRPTVQSYLGPVTKPRILEAVREAKGDRALTGAPRIHRAAYFV